MSFSRFSRRVISSACAPVQRVLVEQLEARRLLAGNGLQGDYYNGKDFNTLVTTRTDATVDFDWGFGSPAAGVNGNFFSTRWTGKIQPPATGNYTFYTTSDDGIRLWVNGQHIVNNWTDHAATENSGSITLTGGQLYDIRIEYYEGINNALARLSWAGPGISKQVVPNGVLFTPDTTGPVEPQPTLPVLNLTAVIAAVNEDSANTSALILARSGPTDNALTVTINRSGTATNGVDYSFPATMTFAPRTVVVRIPFEPITDTLVEGNEFVTFSIAPAPGYIIENGVTSITIIDNDFPPEGDGSGLKAEYFNGRNFDNKVTERNDATVNFDWGYNAPVAGVGADNFSVRWTGQVLASSTGSYTFYTTSDDGVRLWVNGVQIINQWNDHAPTEHSGTINLVAGQKYDIRMEYYEAGNGATAQLRWSGPGVAKQVIPTSALFSSTTPAPVLPNVTITSSDTQGAEAGQSPVLFTITRTGATASALTVPITYTGTATANDFTMLLPTTLTIPDGQSSATVMLIPIDDAAYEGNETLVVTVPANANYTLGTPSSVTLNIADNDTPPQTGTGDGLKAEYFNGRNFETKIAERTDSTINFDWGYGTPIAGVGADNFSVRWTGQVLASSTGSYTFYTTSDDGVRLWVNGVQIINQWNDHAPTEHSGSINLVAGQKYDIRMEYYEAGNGATAQLRWSGPGVAKQVIPTSAIFSSTEVTEEPGVRPGWWDARWTDRIRLEMNGAGYVHKDYVYTAEIRMPVGVDLDSVRVVETTADGLTVLDDNVLYQFDDIITTAGSFIHPVIYIQAKGVTGADQTRYFHVYYHPTNQDLPTYQPSGIVTLSDTTDEGQVAYKVTTPSATYFLQKENGGLSSLLDNDGNDWLSFSPVAGSGSAGEFRGIPNAVFPGGGFHAGFVNAQTVVRDNGPLHVQIVTSAIISRNGVDETWTIDWEFFGDRTVVTIENVDRKPYWFLYEGTPGGSIDSTDFVVRSDGTRTPLSQSWTEPNGVGAANGDRWLYFGDENLDRYLYMGRLSSGNVVDSYYLMENNMTVFGFGRDGGNAYMTHQVQSFVLGLGDGAGYSNASVGINSVYHGAGGSTPSASEPYFI